MGRTTEISTNWRESRGGLLRWFKGLKHMTCMERLRKVGLFSLQSRKLSSDLTEFKYLKMGHREDRDRGAQGKDKRQALFTSYSKGNFS